MRETAAQLGNTAAVCRASYVDASVVKAFSGGRVVTRRVDDVAQLAVQALRGHHRCETSLLVLLGGTAQGPRRRGARRALPPLLRAARTRRGPRRGDTAT